MNFTKCDAKNFLENHLRGAVSEVREISAGEWSQTFSYVYQEKGYIIRFSTTKQSFILDQFAYKFNSEYLPIPRILEIDKWNDHFYAISKKLDGVYLEDLPSIEMKRLLPNLIKTLDTIRNADVSNSKGFGILDSNLSGKYSSWREYLNCVDIEDESSSVYPWRNKLEQDNALLKEFNNFLNEFRELLDIVPNSRYLIHSDLLHYNVLVQKDKISAVLDWGCLKYGDFMYDITWFIFWAPWHSNMKDINFRSIFKNHFNSLDIKVQNFESIVKCYSLHMLIDSIIYLVFKGDIDFAWRMVKYGKSRIE